MGFTIIKTDKFKTGFVHDRREEFLLDSIDDASSLPQFCAPGSRAYTADMVNVWQMSPNGEWVKVVGGSGGSSGGTVGTEDVLMYMAEKEIVVPVAANTDALYVNENGAIYTL